MTDLTKTQFNAAMKRNGFKHTFLFWFEDTTGQMTIHVPGVFLRNGKLRRRETLARLIRTRAREVKRREAIHT